MNIYLAAHYPRIQEMQKIAKKLRDAGHTITSRWIDGGETGKSWAEIAAVDEEDVKACDTMLVFTGPFTTPNGEPVPGHVGIGHHVEYGLAYGLGKHVVVIGPFESPLHQFYGVDHFATFNKYIKSRYGMAGG